MTKEIKRVLEIIERLGKSKKVLRLHDATNPFPLYKYGYKKALSDLKRAIKKE